MVSRINLVQSKTISTPLMISVVILGFLVSIGLVVGVWRVWKAWIRHRAGKKRQVVIKNMHFMANQQTMGRSSSASLLYNHPQFSNMNANSVPFVPVTISNAQQSKIYEVKNCTLPKLTFIRPPPQPAAEVSVNK